MPEHLTQTTREAAFELTCEPGPDSWKFRCSLRNASSFTFFVFDQLYRSIAPGAKFAVDRSLVYCEIAPAAIVLSKKVPPVPGDLEVESRVVPCATRLGSNDTLTAEFSLSVPVSPHFPYPQPAVPGVPASGLLPWFFELGYAAIPPDGEKVIRVVETPSGPAYYLASFAAERQRLLRVGPFREPLPYRIPERR